VAKLGVDCGEGALVLAFSLKEKGTRKMGWGLFPFALFIFTFNFSLYIGSLKNFMTIMHESTF
jgi:hypothetical protein